MTCGHDDSTINIVMGIIIIIIIIIALNLRNGGGHLIPFAPLSASEGNSPLCPSPGCAAYAVIIVLSADRI